MGTWVAAIVAVLTVTGCKYGADSFACTDNASCGAAGVCQANNLCSFPDATCPSGQRYGDIAGTNSGQCVGETQMPPDAMPDMMLPPDARVCFGSDPLTICLASAPTSPLTISTATKIDTTSSSMCVATTSGGANYCVVAATNITITAKLRGVGSKPLVLLASDSISISTSTGLVDVGNHRGDADLGAGADPTTPCTGGTPPGQRGGGAGGSFAGKGGNGGRGNGGGQGGQAANGTTAVTELRGGCPGQAGDGGAAGAGGRGGGAVYLLAGNRLEITTGAAPNTGINAAGEGGAQGAPNNGNSSGAGGAGSGGMIVFSAFTFNVDGLILASGGGGGEGSGEQNPGNPGSDPADTDPAAGGTGNAIGGNGGVGSPAMISGKGGDGNDGGQAGNDNAAGGGGGGGAGLIKAPASASLGTLVSPPSTP
jgi:hypothetical protein